MKLLKLNLHLFEGEGGETGANTQAQTQGETITNDQVANDQGDAQIKVSSNALEDRKKAFDDLINGEYKDLYTEKTQQMINKRFKETKNLQAQLDESNSVIEMLKDKYKVNDSKQLMEKIESDDNWWYDMAEEAGMTVEQFKQYQKLKKENDQFKKAAEEQRKQEETNRITSQWMQEAETLKSKFPNFDMATEIQNPAFLKLLQANTPVEHAYKVVHFDEILAQEKAATETAITQNIRAKGMRPQENGTVSQSSFTVKGDVSKLTAEQRKDIAKRVARGEKITFGI